MIFSSSNNPDQTRIQTLRLRSYAFLIDMTVIGFLQKILVLTYTRTIRELLITIPSQAKSLLLNNTQELLLPTLVFSVFTYFFCFYYFSKGTTPGKALLNLQVMNISGEESELTLFQCMNRSLLSTFCYTTGSILFLISFLRKDMRGLPDFISGTQVRHKDYKSLIKKEEEVNKPKAQLELFVA